jgi:hypothetical protein
MSNNNQPQRAQELEMADTWLANPTNAHHPDRTAMVAHRASLASQLGRLPTAATPAGTGHDAAAQMAAEAVAVMLGKPLPPSAARDSSPEAQLAAQVLDSHTRASAQ